MLGERIRAERKKQGMTSDYLAELCGVDSVHIRHIETGKRNPSIQIFIKICNVLKISSDYLLEDELVYKDNISEFEIDELATTLSPDEKRIVRNTVRSMTEAFRRFH